MLHPRFHMDESGVAKMPLTAAASAPSCSRSPIVGLPRGTRWPAASSMLGNPTAATAGRVVVGATVVVGAAVVVT